MDEKTVLTKSDIFQEYAYLTGRRENLGEEKPTIAGNSINHPAHYNQGKFEPIDVIEDWQLNFHLGNAVKYIARAKHKGDYKENLQKAIWYLQRELDRYDHSATRG